MYMYDFLQEKSCCHTSPSFRVSHTVVTLILLFYMTRRKGGSRLCVAHTHVVTVAYCCGHTSFQTTTWRDEKAVCLMRHTSLPTQLHGATNMLFAALHIMHATLCRHTSPSTITWRDEKGCSRLFVTMPHCVVTPPFQNNYMARRKCCSRLHVKSAHHATLSPPLPLRNNYMARRKMLFAVVRHICSPCLTVSSHLPLQNNHMARRKSG